MVFFVFCFFFFILDRKTEKLTRGGITDLIYTTNISVLAVCRTFAS